MLAFTMTAAAHSDAPDICELHNLLPTSRNNGEFGSEITSCNVFLNKCDLLINESGNDIISLVWSHDFLLSNCVTLVTELLVAVVVNE